MKRNIRLLPFILSLRYAWFWIGIWLPFYLTITDYTGIGFLESAIFFIGFLIEIPTGVISDVIGKKNIIRIGFVLLALGSFIMGISESFPVLVLAVSIQVIATALFSGSDEALLFDTLKSLNKEDKFEKILSRSKVYGLVMMSITGLIGVLLYDIWIGLPFIVTGLVYLVGAGLMFLIKEPPIDTEKFTIRETIKQNFGGFSELKAIKKDRYRLTLVFIASASALIFIEAQDPAILVDKQISDTTLGILYSLIPLVTALGTFIYEKSLGRKHLSNIVLLFIILSIFGGIAISPWISLGFTMMLLLYRNLFYDILGIISSNIINQNISSAKRATTLSTYSMIKSLPYIVPGIFYGILIDKFGASVVASGIALITLNIIVFIVLLKQSRRIR